MNSSNCIFWNKANGNDNMPTGLISFTSKVSEDSISYVSSKTITVFIHKVGYPEHLETLKVSKLYLFLIFSKHVM